MSELFTAPGGGVAQYRYEGFVQKPPLKESASICVLEIDAQFLQGFTYNV